MESPPKSKNQLLLARKNMEDLKSFKSRMDTTDKIRKRSIVENHP